MKNTLLIGDYLFVKKFAYGVPIPHIPWLEIPVLPDLDGDGHLIEGERPKRGDIVIFRYPVNPKIHYVKRCIAVGGDMVFVHNKDLYLHPHEGDDYVKKHYKGFEIVTFDGHLWVKNPYMKDHPGIHHDPSIIREAGYPLPIFEYGPTKVPKDHFFMMGDNRDHSNDSRFWGFVPYKYVVGKPWFIYWSWDENYIPRWDRLGKTVKEIEEEMKAQRK